MKSRARWPVWCWLLSLAVLLLCAAQLLAAATPHLTSFDRPPAWVAEHRGALQAGNELKMFAAVLLLAGLIGARATARRLVGAAALIAAAAFSLVPVVLVLIVVIEGRLSYPLPGLELTSTATVVIASCIYGGLHAVSILLGLGVLAVGVATWSRNRLMTVGVSGLVGTLQIVASFNWLVSATVESLAALTLLTWAFAALHQLFASDGQRI